MEKGLCCNQANIKELKCNRIQRIINTHKGESFIKRFLYYLICTIVLGCLFYGGAKWNLRLEQVAMLEFDLRYVVMFTLIFPIVFGMLLRLPRLIIEIKENIKWAFDWVKFIVVAIPILLILCWSYFPYFGFPVPELNLIAVMQEKFTYILGIVLGYTLLDCLKR